jgi:hypothetical protein
LFLLFRCYDDITGRDKGRLWRCEDRQIVILLMNIVTRALSFDATLEATVVAIVRSVSDAQIVNTLLWSEVNPADEREGEREKFEYFSIGSHSFNSHPVD